LAGAPFLTKSFATTHVSAAGRRASVCSMRSPRGLGWPLCLSVLAACSIRDREVEEAAPGIGGNLGGASYAGGGSAAGPPSTGVGGSSPQKPPLKGEPGGSGLAGCKDDGFFSGGAFDDVLTGSGGDPGSCGDSGSGGNCGDPSVGCAWDAPFVSVRPLVELNQSDEDYGCELFSDERKIYFVSRRGPGAGPELWTASRGDPFQAFGEASSLHVLEPIGASGFTLSRDELTIYLYNHGLLQTAARKSPDEPFGVAEDLVLPPPLQEPDLPHESDSGRFYVGEIFDRTAGIYQLAELGAMAAPTLVLEAPASGAYSPVLSHDELTMYFASPTTREESCMTWRVEQIWVATRASVTGPFTIRGVVSSLSSRYDAVPSALSNDGCRLYYSRPTKRGDTDLYVAEKATPGCPPP
jgi:hypothetical protein